MTAVTADSEPERADGVQREARGATAARTNGRTGTGGRFRRGTPIGNDPQLGPRDGRFPWPMSTRTERRTFSGSF